MRGDCPVRVFRRHEIVIEVARRSTILGLVGGLGKVAGSGVLWKMMFGFLGSSTESDADQEVSPLSELAVQVYRAVSCGDRSVRKKKYNVVNFILRVSIIDLRSW